MMDWILFFAIGLIVGWNLIPQPLWIKNIYDKIKAKLFRKKTSCC